MSGPNPEYIVTLTKWSFTSLPFALMPAFLPRLLESRQVPVLPPSKEVWKSGRMTPEHQVLSSCIPLLRMGAEYPPVCAHVLPPSCS